MKGELHVVLHVESSNAWHTPPRNTEDRSHLQLTQATLNRHNAQTKHQELSKGQQRPRSQAPGKSFLETARVEAANSASSQGSANAGGPAQPCVSWDRETKQHAPVPVRPYLSHFNACLASADTPGVKVLVLFVGCLIAAWLVDGFFPIVLVVTKE